MADAENDLRRILAQNIRKMRGIYHITQEKLAERAELSLSYLADIEYCKTWVSDKTLRKIAEVFNKEPYELLVPPKPEEEDGSLAEKPFLPEDFQAELASLITTKKAELRAHVDSSMASLTIDILKAAGGRTAKPFASTC
jgi:transcriptional regulator with XRE-family HTH domain